MNFIMIAVLVLGAIALIAALVLFVVSKKFAVDEDPRLGQVGEILPGANCGGCGFAGCSGMAAALVKGADAGSIEGLMCPVGGADVMGKVADLLGIAVANTDPKVAVVRCNGSCEHRPRIAEYDGLHTCAAMNSCGAGETGCGLAVWAVATVWLPVSSVPSLSIPRQVFPRWMRRSVLAVVPVPRPVHATSLSFARRVLRVVVCMFSASITTRAQ